MDAPFAFPDAVAVTIAYLNSRLPTYIASQASTCPVHSEVPTVRPARFVQVFRTGGPRHNLVVDAAQLTIASWAPSKAAAMDLANIVRAVLLAVKSDVVNGTTVYKIDELAGPADFPDQQSAQSRVIWSVIALVRGTDLQPVP